MKLAACFLTLLPGFAVAASWTSPGFPAFSEQGTGTFVSHAQLPKGTRPLTLNFDQQCWQPADAIKLNQMLSLQPCSNTPPQWRLFRDGEYTLQIDTRSGTPTLMISIQNAAELARAHRQYQLLRESLEERYGKHQIIGRSRAIRDMLALVDRAGPSRATVLITGESGTGKELVARAIHFSSPRSQEPFVSVNCMALNPGVLESELFGHEKGSFTGAVAMRRGRFEQASGGTLFLDEVGELTPELQVKLLRVLQERRFERVGGSEEIEVDIRIVAATNKDLMPLVQAGTFREDLYYRLNVVHIPIPPLRERREDIPLLVAHFAEKAAKENGIPPKTFSTEALNHLSGYEWPGNIRQLQNVVERCLVLVPGDVITLEDLPAEIRDEEAQFKSAVDLLPVQLDLADPLERIEAALIRRALVRADFVQAKAAELLGISKSLMQYKLKKYSITGH